MSSTAAWRTRSSGHRDVLMGLRRRGQLDHLCGAWFVELDCGLAFAVDNCWRSHMGQPGEPPLGFLANDVWDLVREPARFPEVLQATPPGGLLLILGGSPCTQLGTWTAGGLLGLTGPASRNFFVFYFLLTAIPTGLSHSCGHPTKVRSHSALERKQFRIIVSSL